MFEWVNVMRIMRQVLILQEKYQKKTNSFTRVYSKCQVIKKSQESEIDISIYHVTFQYIT